MVSALRGVRCICRLTVEAILKPEADLLAQLVYVHFPDVAMCFAFVTMVSIKYLTGK